MDERALNILLVDDDDVDVMNVRRAFDKARVRHPITTARDGLEALELLRADALPAGRRLILLDLNMPRMSGIEFLHELRADPRLAAHCVVVLTTSDADRDRLAAYRLNVAGYLVKPVTFGKFADAMATLSDYWTAMELP